MKVRLLIAALVVTAVSTGCDNPPKVVNPDPKTSKLDVRHPDLPAPEGFVYDTNITDTSPTGAFRIINQTMTGKNRRVEGAAKFYKEVLPTHGWTAEGEEGTAAGPMKLKFVKKDERCQIEIKDKSQTEVGIALKVNRKE
jgi:hypothetical protein